VSSSLIINPKSPEIGRVYKSLSCIDAKYKYLNIQNRSFKMTNKKAKVLIVDDDKMVGEDLSDDLSMSGKYEPLIADSGNKAIEEYESNRDLGLVILDTDLGPVEKGWQVYDRLREAGYQGPALARSGRDETPEWKTRSVQFLSKTAKREELGKVVNSLIENYAQ